MMSYSAKKKNRAKVDVGGCWAATWRLLGIVSFASLLLPKFYFSVTFLVINIAIINNNILFYVNY